MPREARLHHAFKRIAEWADSAAARAGLSPKSQTSKGTEMDLQIKGKKAIMAGGGAKVSNGKAINICVNRFDAYCPQT